MVSVYGEKGASHSLTVESEGQRYRVPNLGYDPSYEDWHHVADFGSKKIYTMGADYLREGYAFQLAIHAGKYATLKLAKLCTFGKTYLPKGYYVVDSPAANPEGEVAFAYRGVVSRAFPRHYDCFPVRLRMMPHDAIYVTNGRLTVEIAISYNLGPKYMIDIEGLETGPACGHYDQIESSALKVRKSAMHTSFKKERLCLAQAITWLFDYQSYDDSTELERLEVSEALSRIRTEECYERILKMLRPHKGELWQRLLRFTREHDHKAVFAPLLADLMSEL